MVVVLHKVWFVVEFGLMGKYKRQCFAVGLLRFIPQEHNTTPHRPFPIRLIVLRASQLDFSIHINRMGRVQWNAQIAFPLAICFLNNLKSQTQRYTHTHTKYFHASLAVDVERPSTLYHIQCNLQRNSTSFIIIILFFGTTAYCCVLKERTFFRRKVENSDERCTQ